MLPVAVGQSLRAQPAPHLAQLLDGGWVVPERGHAVQQATEQIQAREEHSPQGRLREWRVFVASQRPA